jgi:arylsulfatase A-like enzyme
MGVTFTQATTPQALCGPARHSLHTGVSSASVPDKWMRNLAPWRPNGRFLAEVLAEAGYRTGGFGKMHFIPIRAHNGFQHFALHEEMEKGYYPQDCDYIMYLRQQGLGHLRCVTGVRGLLYYQPQISPIPEEHHEVTWVANQAIDFINTFHKEPFFLYASWMQPHWPVNVPASFADLYPLDDIAIPKFAENERLPWHAQMQRLASDMFDSGRPDSLPRLKRSKALYYASISFIDQQIGRILDALERKNLLADSLIIFTSDHGELLGDHMTFGKVAGFEPSIRIPFIMACPGLENRGACSEDLVTLYDVAPTVYDFTAAPPPPRNELVGSSLLCQRDQVRQRDRVFFEMGKGGAPSDHLGVRTRKWKYVFNHAGPVRQLFDLENDPDELNNLCRAPLTPEHAKIQAELHQGLLAWNCRHGLASRIEDGDFKILPFSPIAAGRNAQYDHWTDYLSDAEKAGLWSEARSVYEAIKNEKHLDPAELDLEYWEKRRGKGCIAELEKLMNRKLR